MKRIKVTIVLNIMILFAAIFYNEYNSGNYFVQLSIMLFVIALFINLDTYKKLRSLERINEIYRLRNHRLKQTIDNSWEDLQKNIKELEETENG
jgi:amino acid permease